MNIPDYITDKRNTIRLVVFTALFALIFINIYKPFSSSDWYDISEFKFFIYSSLIILTGVLVVILSRIIMYFHRRKNAISYLRYAVWILFEILFMSLFYTIYTLAVNRTDPAVEIMDTFKTSVINTSLVLLLPYSFYWFYFGWRYNAEKLKSMQDNTEKKQTTSIAFKDEKGIIRLSLLSSELLYIESSDNYACIHYISNGKIKNYLLRNTLKNLEEQLENNSIVRCHRSYMVNMERVSVIRREKGNVLIEMDTERVPEIPVSKNYQVDVSEKFIST